MLTMDNNLRNHWAAEDGSVIHENLEGQNNSKTSNDDFLSTSQTTSKNIFPLHLREYSHDIWLHPSTKTMPNPISTTSISLADVTDSSVDNYSSTVSGKADDLVCHGRTKLLERSLVSQRPSSGCSCKSFEVLKWVATQENNPNEYHLGQCHSIHTEADGHSSGTFLNEDQLCPSSGSQMSFPHHHLNHDKEEVISTLMEEVRHLRQELSSQTSKQQALETLMQKALVELEEAKAEIMKLQSEIARSTSDDKMAITSLQNGLNMLQNEIAQDSFKRAEEILKLEKNFSDSQQSLEQIQATLLKNEVTSGQRLEVEHSLKADLQEVQNKLSALLKDKDSILSSGTPAQLVPILQQPVPSEMERKTFSTIDPTTDKETSQTELVSQSRTGSTSEEPKHPDNSERINVVVSTKMVATTIEESSVANVPSTEESSKKDQVFDSFNKMDLKSELLHGIYSYGIERPTTLQQKAIVPCLKGNDIIVQAGPGTGKTTMYLISILQKIDTCLKECQAIVLVLDGKHAQQIQKRLLSLGGQMGAQCHAFIGETNVLEDLKKLCSSGVHVVVGTPGRIFDMISRRALSTKYIKLLVLDEADEMLSWGFEEQIYDVFKHLSEDIQVIFFCDTMTGGFEEDIEDGDEGEDKDVEEEYIYNDVVKATKNLMKNPIHILIKEEELNSEGIKHFYSYYSYNNNKSEENRHKIKTLRYLYNQLSVRDRYDTLHITQAIIFCNDSEAVDFIRSYNLQENLFPLHVFSVHERDRKKKETIMRDFCSGSSRFLFTTDIRARPVDVQQVSLVVNYDLPPEMETYINRIVRCGRFGRKGVALSFVTERDTRIIEDIKRHYIDVTEVMSDEELEDIVDLL